MRIAIPIIGEKFCEHFGRADGFFLCEVDPTTRAADRPRQVVRPKGKCEQTPQWLKDMAVTAVLVGGIGEVAQQHLAALGILVVPGQKGQSPLELAEDYLRGKAAPRHNVCQTMEHRLLHCRKKPAHSANARRPVA